MLEAILSVSFIHALLVATVRMSTPLLFTALGEMYSERAGLVNIGLDGIMTIGALFGFLGTYITGNPLFGVLLGTLSGILINMIYAFSTVTIRANQIVNGMALNILCPAFYLAYGVGVVVHEYGIKYTLPCISYIYL